MPHPILRNLALAVALSIAGQAWATPVDLDLPRQPLATSLRQLAEAAQLTLAVDNSIVPDRLAPAVQGRLEPISALSQLLQGSGLVFRQQGSTLVILRGDDSAVELRATDINSVAIGETTEGTRSYTTGPMRTATKMQMSMRETPQSVSVITRQRMDDQNIQNLDEVARTTTGISYTKIGTDRSTYYARGFEINDLNYVRRERGVYGATRLSLTDDLSLILGSRVSWSDYQVPSDRYRENARVVPYAGLVYALDTHHSLYASYTQIYKTQSSYAPGNSLLEPVDGENYETGIKGEYFDGALNTSLALFQTDLRNMPEAIAGVRNCGVTFSSTCYQEGAKVRNRGFEVEISGQPLEGWNLSAGYTFSDPEYVAGASKGNDYYTRIPRRLLKVSSDYRLPGVLDQWRVGGDVFAQSRTATSASTYDIRQSGYALLNLHANYQINRQLSLQYNLNNALDKKYYQSLPTSNNWGGLYYGDPRNFAVTLRYQY